MGAVEIIGLVIGLITTFGPKAVDIWNDFHAEVGDNPTQAQWDALKEKIRTHDPDSY